MGLSDSERVTKVIFAINAIVVLSREGLDNFDEICYHDNVKILFKKGKNLWRSILSKKGNSLFWICGNDETVGFSNTTLLSTALYHKIRYAKNNKIEDRNKNDESDNFEIEFYKNRFSIEGFLDSIYERVYKIYIWCQQIQYAVNRYDDKLSKSYKQLMNVISDIMGLIFNIMNGENNFAQAWLWHEICEKLYGGKYWFYNKEKFDDITKFLIDRHLHHYLGKRDKDIFILREILADLEKDNSANNRLKWIIQLTAYNIHQNKFYHKELEQLCIKYNYPWKLVKKKFRKEEKHKKENDEVSTKNYKDEKSWDRIDLLNLKHDYEK